MTTALNSASHIVKSYPWRVMADEGRQGDAEQALLRELQINPAHVDALHDLGILYARRGAFQKAVTYFLAATQVDPQHEDCCRSLAMAYGDLGRFDEADAALTRCVELKPESISALQNLGHLRCRAERWQAAEEVFLKAIALKPDLADLHNDLGRVLAKLKKRPEAKTAFLKATELDPQSGDAFGNLGIACKDMNQNEEAIKYLNEAIRLRPGNAGAYNNLGVALSSDQKFPPAAEAYNKALAIDPFYAVAWNNLGNALRSMDQNQAAAAAILKAIQLQPDYAEAYNNLAITCKQAGDDLGALRHYNKALSLRPNYAEGHMNRALGLLHHGDFENGWADYEWRWRLEEVRLRNFPQPRWDGSPLGGKRIVLHYEQGLGDTIQFIRYAAELKRRGATVIFEGQEPLREILSRTPGIDQFVVRGQPLPEFDVHSALLSLPPFCQTNQSNIPAEIPYIFGDPEGIARWKTVLDEVKGSKIGIAWQGNPQHRGDRWRSFPLKIFESLAQIPGVRLISLQRNFGSEQVVNNPFEVLTFEGIHPEGDGFLRTAAIMRNLDLIITPDTALAHLAGAMGLPIWCLIPSACDWRWLRDREDSPWYPTLRLFRQRELGNWNEVFGRVTQAVSERVASHSPRESALVVDPELTRERLRKAGDALKSERVVEAQELLELTVSEDPTNADAQQDLGVALAKQGKLSLAMDRFRRALELKPDHVMACGNLGLAFLRRGQIDEAITHLRKVIRLGGGSSDIYNHLGLALLQVPEPVEAESCFIKTLHLRPDYAAAHCNLARALLLQGKFEQGWLEHEWRWELHSGRAHKPQQPRWAGQPLAGRTIQLYAEPGTSPAETLQMLRYASVIQSTGARVIVECQEELKNLLTAGAGVDQVVAPGDERIRPDVFAALLSLPGILATTLQTIPAPKSYLRADESLTQSWARRFESLPGFKVGIAADADPDGFSAEYLGSLRDVAGVTLVSLQSPQQRPIPGAVNFGGEIGGGPGLFANLAAIIANLDLVICNDSTVAHIAGAMGVPVWVALPASPHHRWLLERQDSPWYPSMKLFRQSRRGDWKSVLEQIAAELPDRAISLVTSGNASAGREESQVRAIYEQGRRSAQNGDLPSAEKFLLRAVEARPSWPEAHQDLAVVLARQKKLSEALSHFGRAVELAPDSRTARSDYALALMESGDFSGAARELEALLLRAPDSAEFHCRLGDALAALGRFDDAGRHLERSTVLQTDHPRSHLLLGRVRKIQGRLEEASQSFHKALVIRPDWLEALCQLGSTLLALGRNASAAEIYRRALGVQPRSAEAHNGLGTALANAGDVDGAIGAFQEAVYLEPDHPESHGNLARALLTQGRYEQGWLEQEWRLRVKRSAPRRRLPGRSWDGGNLSGKTLFMAAEESFGDTLQFVRYGELAKAMGARVIAESPPSAAALLARCPFIDEVVTGTALPRYDFYSYMMSLPIGFRTTLETIPAKTPYLFADPQRRLLWDRRLPDRSRRRLGILWKPPHSTGNHASIPLSELGRLGQISNHSLISLQPGIGIPGELASVSFPVFQPEGLASAMVDWEEIAALLMCLDAVVTCDSVLAHLAGGLGLRVYLACQSDWRWHAAWYPTMKLFRQENPGDWAGVLDKIGEELGE